MVFIILDRGHANWPLQVIMTLATMAWLHTVATVEGPATSEGQEEEQHLYQE